MAEKILHYLEMPTMFTFKVFCDKINQFIQGGRDTHIEFCFHLFDSNSDGVICITDAHNHLLQMPDQDHLFQQDVMLITNELLGRNDKLISEYGENAVRGKSAKAEFRRNLMKNNFLSTESQKTERFSPGIGRRRESVPSHTESIRVPTAALP